jgi:hypothetical protein
MTDDELGSLRLCVKTNVWSYLCASVPLWLKRRHQPSQAQSSLVKPGQGCFLKAFLKPGPSFWSNPVKPLQPLLNWFDWKPKSQATWHENELSKYLAQHN